MVIAVKFRISFICAVIFTAASCSVLTQSQIEMTEALALSSDSLTRSPSVIFRNVSEVNRERALFYSASLSSPEAHLLEIQSAAKHASSDEIEALKTDIYINILNSYCRALKSLAADQRHNSYGTEIRGIGRKTDSVLVALNGTVWIKNDIATGYAKLSSRYVALIAESIVKGRQAKAVKEFVTEADTLISECVEDLVAILKSDEVTALITNEKNGLEDDYRVFLTAATAQNTPPPMFVETDRMYLALIRKLDDASRIRTSCITALRTFSRAHSRLKEALSTRGTKENRELVEQIYDDIAELNAISVSLVKLIK